MSALEDLAAAVQGTAADLRALALDPGDAIRLLMPLATFSPDGGEEADAVGVAMSQARAATSALCRRAALAALARAAAAAEPRTYDEAVALRDRLTALLEAETTIAADAGDDASAAALRGLRDALNRRLSERAGSLPRLRTYEAPGVLPSLVHAYRLYGDLGRADEVSAYADAEAPLFVGGTFPVRGA